MEAIELIAFACLIFLVLVGLAAVGVLTEVRDELRSIRHRMEGTYKADVTGTVKGVWEEDSDDWWKHGKPNEDN